MALTEGFGGIGRAVSTPDELAMVLSEIRATPNHNFVVEVRVPETSIPHGLQSELSSIGEDETAHPDWPPASKF
ncbi:MAG: hypothetical protein HN404_15755 [Gemmatimonadetes bacterium]|nr:hypothetical protein [Gemmatimonadota bacterium]